jgi:glycosyltransferase involved in cell wall biosynthesis
VATAAGGTATVVTDGVSGYLAPVGDTDALAERLVRLAGDPALREELGRAGAGDVRDRFATARMADELDELYRAVLR